MPPIPNHRYPLAWPVWPAAASALAGLVLAAALGAERPLIGPTKNYSVALDYFEPPYQNQKKSLLAGAEAEFQTATIILLKQVRLETYQVTGEKELIVETPSCTFDLTRHMAFSNGPIKAQTGTGDLRVEGVGFSWRQTQTNSSLTISNKIHTVIKRPLAASVPVQP